MYILWLNFYTINMVDISVSYTKCYSHLNYLILF
jgi:hypothetical protein